MLQMQSVECSRERGSTSQAEVICDAITKVTELKADLGERLNSLRTNRPVEIFQELEWCKKLWSRNSMALSDSHFHLSFLSSECKKNEGRWLDYGRTGHQHFPEEIELRHEGSEEALEEESAGYSVFVRAQRTTTKLLTWSTCWLAPVGSPVWEPCKQMGT